MNAKELTKSTGRPFRVRPIAIRKGFSGEREASIDDQWILEAVLSGPTRVRLRNSRTHHTVELEADNVIERRSPDFLLLRCQLYVTPDGLLIEPIFRGTPITPSAGRSGASAEPPTSDFNVPRGYERRLAYHRYRILKDQAARSPDGGYRFPVAVKGADADIRAFTHELHRTLGVFPAVTRSSDGVGEIEFTYAGPAGPEQLENLAIKYRLTIAQCGNTITL